MMFGNCDQQYSNTHPNTLKREVQNHISSIKTYLDRTKLELSKIELS